MFKLNLKSGIPLLVAVAIVTVGSFAPGLTPTPIVEASSCRNPWSYYNSRVESTWYECAWHFGCWANPFAPNGHDRNCVRTCADKRDPYGYCGTDCWTNCTWFGGCC